jgi:hypothetical protein
MPDGSSRFSGQRVRCFVSVACLLHHQEAYPWLARIVGDSDWGHRYRSYALGFTKALMMAITK